MRFISSRDLTKYFANMPPSLSISAQGRGEEHFSSVKLCFQNMDERLPGRIVLKYHSSCWFSLFVPLNSQSGNNFTFVYLQSGVLYLLNHAVYILKSNLFCFRCIFQKFSAHFIPKNTTHRQAETTLRRSIIRILTV